MVSCNNCTYYSRTHSYCGKYEAYVYMNNVCEFYHSEQDAEAEFMANR